LEAFVFGAIISTGLLVSLIVVAVKSSDDGNETNLSTTLSTSVPSTTLLTTEATDETTEVPASTVCLTKTCIDTASKLLAQIDESVDPCEDFYEFSCGNFLKEAVIPDDKAAINSFNNIEDEVRVQLRKIVEEPEIPTEIKPSKNVRNLYKSCMDTSGVDSRGVQPLRDLLKDLGGFPLIDGAAWDTDGTWTWPKFIVEAKKKGFKPEAFFNFEVAPDFMASTARTIEVYSNSAPTLSMLSFSFSKPD
jgi:neprilysin